MPRASSHLDETAAEAYLMRYLSIEGVTGQEEKIGQAIRDDLIALGLPADQVTFDDAHTRIPLPTQTGNLIAKLPGTAAGPHLLFSTHLDTVPLCAGAKPRREGDRIVGDGTTALGGDNRTGCAMLVTLAETLIKHKLPHPPITLLFTVREESGLHGARELNAADLGPVEMCFNVDAQLASQLITGAVGQQNWEVDITGKAAHAGVAPEKGISATLVGAIGLAEAKAAGWFGKIVKPDGHGTSNVGIFGGKGGKGPAGDATNVVTDHAWMRGEARSPSEDFIGTIVGGLRDAFDRARAQVTDAGGETAKVEFIAVKSYPPFTLSEDSDAVRRAVAAVRAVGLEPGFIFSNGGLDANWLDKKGIPTVTIGAGQYEIHTIHEYVDLPEYLQGCRVAIELATL
jgi:tripeptide aminopeptidase